MANLDLLSVGIMVAVTCVLGFTVYFNNRKSITNRLFLALSLVMAIWGIVNYFCYQFSDVGTATLLTRLVLFFAAIQGIFLYELFIVFPNDTYIFSKANKFFVAIGILVSILTLTPYVFYSISGPEILNNANMGSLWISFTLFSAYSILATIFILLNKIYKSYSEERKRLIILFVGLITTYTLIFIFSLVLPMVFRHAQYIIFGPLFTFPFTICTSYAILKHNLFKLQVTETMIMMIVVLSTSFLEVIFSNGITEIILRSCIFLFTILFTILILKVVVREIKQRKEIQDLHMHLKEVDELKSEIVSLARHHIANPLTALKGYVSLFQEGEYGDISENKKQTLDNIGRITDNLVTIVRDFIDVSRLEDGKIKYSFSDVDFYQLVQEVMDKYKPITKQRGIDLIYKHDQINGQLVRADPEKILRAINNILENSIKYTTRGSIEIELYSDRNKFYLNISDTGIRVLPSTPSKLVEKFSSSGNKDEADIITNSLGLYFTKQAVKAHIGDFRIESNSEGHGSQFNMELPVMHT